MTAKTIEDLERVAEHGFVVRCFVNPSAYSVVILASGGCVNTRHGFKPTISAAIEQAIGETDDG